MAQHNFPVHMEVGDIWGNSKEKFLVIERHEKGEANPPSWIDGWENSSYRYYYYCCHLPSGQYVRAYSNDRVSINRANGTVDTYGAHLTFPSDHSAHGKTISHPKGYTKPQRSLWKWA